MDGLYAQNPSMIEIAVAVEKLLRAKLLKTKLRRDALEATLSVFERSPNPPILAVWQETGLFQQPRLLTTSTTPLPKWACPEVLS
jgi:hypothetical protein